MRHTVAFVRTKTEICHVTVWGVDAEHAVQEAKKRAATGMNFYQPVAEDMQIVYVGEVKKEGEDVRADH